MAYTTLQTPRGTKDFLPRDARRKRWMEDTLLGLFGLWNYGEIITPTMEYHDAVCAGGATGLADNLYRFFEKEGELIALKPDATTPVARVVASRLKDEPKPIRLCYSTNVFRYGETHAQRRREFYQIGVELVGQGGYIADAEIIALAVQALQAVGLRDFRIDIGHVDYYDGILQHSTLSHNERRQIRGALLKKDYVALSQMLNSSGLDPAQRRLLKLLPDLRGGEDTLDEALDLATNPVSKKAVTDLIAIYNALKAYGLDGWVQVDLGMIKDIQYYTGMVLEAYTSEMGFTLGTGGRYDNLISQFGYQCPATGFALGVDRVMLALSRQGSWPPEGAVPVLCGINGHDLQLGWQVAETIRQKGHRVEMDVAIRDREELTEYAKAIGFDWVILPISPGKLRYWHIDKGWQEGELAKLLDLLGGGENYG